MCVRWPFIGRLLHFLLCLYPFDPADSSGDLFPVIQTAQNTKTHTHTHMRTQNNGWISPVFGNAVLIGSRLPGFAAGNRDVFVHG